MKRTNTLLVNIENTRTKTPTADIKVCISDKYNTQRKDEPAMQTVNAENNNDSAPNETTNKTDSSDSVHTNEEKNVNTENEPTKVSTTKSVETKNTQATELELTNDVVTTENNIETQKQYNINTDNNDKAVFTENNNEQNEQDELNRHSPTKAPGIVNTENNLPVPTSSTHKEDWSSLMFSSDDSLFDEMTKQLEDDTNKIDEKRKTPTSTIT